MVSVEPASTPSSLTSRSPSRWIARPWSMNSWSSAPTVGIASVTSISLSMPLALIATRRLAG
jgi:hypothetical protein